MKYIVITLMTIFAGCTYHPNEKELSYTDSVNVLSLAFEGKYLKESLLEDRMDKDSIIYIVVDSLPMREHWPDKINEYQVKLTDSFKRNRNFIEQAQDKRFTITPPEINLVGDTLRMKLHSYSFYIDHVFKFVKRKGKWLMVYENALQY